MKNLELNNPYSREEIHAIFSPETKFTRGAGTWGILGLIPIRKRKNEIPNTKAIKNNDFVFIVTYGRVQGEHTFDEGITDEGVLSWQSQPRQKLNDEVIKQLINHDEINNTIYLFLRSQKDTDYEYLGTLKYISHDNQREKPVYFQWQLLDWDSENLKPQVNEAPQKEVSGLLGKLKFSTSKPTKRTAGTTIEQFRSIKAPDYAAKDKRNKALGDLGEELVLEYEKEVLKASNRSDLAAQVVHISKVEGDGAGYDIKSYNIDGSEKFIEVKTTKGHLNTDFFMSPREILFSKLNDKHFFLYRVYGVTKENNASFYIIRGDVTKEFEIKPTGFKLSKK